MNESLAYATPQQQQIPNKLGVRAMIVGIVGLVLSPVVVGGILGLIALIMGIMAVTRPARKAAAVTGIVTGACAMPLALFALFIWAGALMAMAAMPMIRGTMAAHGDLSGMKMALHRFEIENGRYPTTAEGLAALEVAPAGSTTWHGPYMKVPLDPWRKPFVYRGPDTTGTGNYELLTCGPDGVEGTKDDINSSAAP